MMKGGESPRNEVTDPDELEDVPQVEMCEERKSGKRKVG